MAKRLLAGDVGGTKTNLALFEVSGARLILRAVERFASREFSTIERLVAAFLDAHPARLAGACFGVAGPVVSGRCEATNLPWTIDARPLGRLTGGVGVTLINDLAATALGIQTLPASAFATIHPGTVQKGGAIAVIAAGTGLGQAGLVWDGLRYRAVPTEGGHSDFAPRNDLEVELLRTLSKRFGHVSYERLLSGPGKLAIYEFLRDTGRGEEPEWLRRRMGETDPSAVVSEAGLSGQASICVHALEVFVSIYGAAAGNLALQWLATGGVYVGGGIAPTILPKLQDETFTRAFLDKGRLSVLLSNIPVRVILDDKAALYGAASQAALLAKK
jgi:glucokinase